MERILRQETQKENEAHNLMNNVRSLLLVAEQALERGMSGEEFDFTNRVDLMAGINAGKAALRVVGLMEAAAVDEAAKAHREAQRATEEYIPGYCQGCVRIEMDKMDYGKVFPAFKAVASDHCDSCTEDESFAECPNNCADWETTPGESCSCECHA